MVTSRPWSRADINNAEFDETLNAKRVTQLNSDGLKGNSELIFTETGNYSDTETITTGVFDTLGYTSLTFRIKGFQGATQTITSSTDLAQTEGIITSNTTIPETLSLQFFTIPIRARYFSVTLTNNSGSTITDGYLEITGTLSGTPPGSTFPLAVDPSLFSPALLTQSVIKGEQPDGDYVGIRADGEAISTTDTLSAGEEFTSAWVDTDGWATVEVFIRTEEVSADRGVIIEYTDDANAETPSVKAQKFFTYNEVDAERGFKDIRTSTLLDGIRVRYINGAEAQNSFSLQTNLRVQVEGGTFNEGNVQVMGEFAREVALSNISNYGQQDKFGRNTDVDSSNAEDIWSLGGDYTGFNATGNENLSTVSTSTNDVGSLVSSGTVTTSGKFVLIDSNATFVTDGVAVGDVVLNDTQGTHGIITAVDSETQVTIFDMRNGDRGLIQNISSDSYRIATTSGTGAAVVQWSNILDEDYEREVPVYVIMNGTTNVTTTGDFYRLTRGKVVLAGSGNANDGNISCNQAVSTSVVFCQIPSGFSRSLLCADTVANNEVHLIENISASISISGGGSVSGTVSLRARPYGQTFQAYRVFTITGSNSVNDKLVGGIVFQTGVDYKLRVDTVSANNVTATGELEILTLKTN